MITHCLTIIFSPACSYYCYYYYHKIDQTKFHLLLLHKLIIAIRKKIPQNIYNNKLSQLQFKFTKSRLVFFLQVKSSGGVFIVVMILCDLCQWNYINYKSQAVCVYFLWVNPEGNKITSRSPRKLSSSLLLLCPFFNVKIIIV